MFNVKLHHYNPSKEAIARVIEAQCTSNSVWGQNDSTWGKDDGIWGKQDDGSQSQSALGWGPTPEAPQVDPHFPVLERLSGQKSGEDWKTFFAHHLKENKKKQAKESPAQQQSHKSQEQAAKSHNIPGKSSMATVFEWQPQHEYGDFPLHIHLIKAKVPSTWGNYSSSTRLYDSFRNEWDLCNQLDPTSTPDGDWEEDFSTSQTPSLILCCHHPLHLHCCPASCRTFATTLDIMIQMSLHAS